MTAAVGPATLPHRLLALANSCRSVSQVWCRASLLIVREMLTSHQAVISSILSLAVGSFSRPTVSAYAVVVHPPVFLMTAACASCCLRRFSVVGAKPCPWCPHVPWGFAHCHTMPLRFLLSLTSPADRWSLLPILVSRLCCTLVVRFLPKAVPTPRSLAVVSTVTIQYSGSWPKKSCCMPGWLNAATVFGEIMSIILRAVLTM